MQNTSVRLVPVIWKKKVVDINQQLDDDMRAAVRILKSGDMSTIESMLKGIDDVNWKCSDGNTLLHWAATLSNIYAVRVLLGVGADIDAVNAVGATPLHCATLCGSCETINELLLHGADPTIRNQRGHTVFDFMRDLWADTLYEEYEELERVLLGLDGDEQEADNILLSMGISSNYDLMTKRDLRKTVSMYVLRKRRELKKGAGEGDLSFNGEVALDEPAELSQPHLFGEKKKLHAEEAEKRNMIVSRYVEFLRDVSSNLRSVDFDITHVEESTHLCDKKPHLENNKCTADNPMVNQNGSGVWVKISDHCPCCQTHSNRDEDQKSTSARATVPDSARNFSSSLNGHSDVEDPQTILRCVMQLLQRATAPSSKCESGASAPSLPNISDSKNRRACAVRSMPVVPWKGGRVNESVTEVSVPTRFKGAPKGGQTRRWRITGRVSSLPAISRRRDDYRYYPPRVGSPKNTAVKGHENMSYATKKDPNPSTILPSVH